MLANAETYTFSTVVCRPQAGKGWFSIPRDAHNCFESLWSADEVELHVTGSSGAKEVRARIGSGTEVYSPELGEHFQPGDMVTVVMRVPGGMSVSVPASQDDGGAVERGV